MYKQGNKTLRLFLTYSKYKAVFFSVELFSSYLNLKNWIKQESGRYYKSKAKI